MGSRWVNLTCVVLVAMAIRLVMAFLSPPQLELTYTYSGTSYLMAAGYGYTRPTADKWRAVAKELEAYSLELDEVGAQLDAQQRPAIDPGQLQPLHLRLPGYPAFLYLVYRVFGEPLLTWAGVVQAVIGAFYPLLVYLIALKLFQRPGVALASAWMTAVYPPFAIAAVLRLSDSLGTGLLLLAMLAWIHAARKPSFRWMALAGLLMAASCYFKTNAMYLWVFLGLALLIKQPGWWRPAVSTAILAVCIYGAMLPWALRNYKLSGYWLWGSTGAGEAMWEYIGNYPNPWGIRSQDIAARGFAQEHGFESSWTPEANAFFSGLVSQYMKEDPGFFIKSAVKRLPWMLAPPFNSGLMPRARERFKNTFAYYRIEEGLRPLQVLMRHPGHVFMNYWERMLVMIIGGAGSVSMFLLVLVRWRQRGDVALLIALPCYFVAVHALVGGAPRYLTPVIPFHMIAIALGVAEIRDWRLRRTPRQVVSSP